MAVVLASWLTVRRGRLGRKRHAYVVLTDELALVLGGDAAQTAVPLVAGASVEPRRDALRIAVRPADPAEATVYLLFGRGAGAGTAAGTAAGAAAAAGASAPQPRAPASSELELFDRWAQALAAGCAWTLENFYDVEDTPIASGTHGVVRMARPLVAPAALGEDKTIQRQQNNQQNNHRPGGVAAWFRLTIGHEYQQHDRHRLGGDQCTEQLQQQHGRGQQQQGVNEDRQEDRQERRQESQRHFVKSSFPSREFPVRRIVEPGSDDGSFVTLDDSSLLEDAYAKPTSGRFAERLRHHLRPTEQQLRQQSDQAQQTQHHRPNLEQDSLNFDLAVAGTRPAEELYVVKTISKAGGKSATVTSELLAARRYLRHFAIASIVDVFETPTEVHCVSEYVAGPSLHSLICKDGPVYEFDARRILKATVKAVGYMHSRGVAHWDIRPRNIMLTQKLPPFGPKLIDFGTSIEISTKTGQRVQGNRASEERGIVSSLHFAPPEVLVGKGRRFASKVDSWQLGAVLYTMLFGDLPFVKSGNFDPMEREAVGQVILDFSKMHKQERYDFLFATERTRSITISDDAKGLIMSFLCPNPRMRISLFEALTSPFLV